MYRRTSMALPLLAALAACTPSPGGQQQPSASASADARAEARRRFVGTPALKEKLAAAVHDKGDDYQPRTKHLSEGGAPKYTNRLILESSPYLLQHAHNPVNWFPWGDEAFELAAALGRPVFLSVGYSTCHWCHVMEEESFEDEAIAAYINAHYVPIKVDREERPDVDAVYMKALHATGQRGGWPMSVWLTPERAPFYGATYLPPRDGARGRAKGFLTILKEQRAAYDADPAAVAADAEAIAAKVRADMAPPTGGGAVGPEAVVAAIAFADRRYDAELGGTKGAPKFPSSFPIRLLLQFGRRAGDEHATEMALSTLRHMAAGGIHDHVGGGFHRYSVDRKWLVPHFEKMLYDQALLALAYLDGFQQSGDDELAEVARRILDYVLREMTHPKGGFYSATDADSPTPAGEREEGWYFTWTPAELRRVLDEDQTAAVLAFYGVTEGGNFEGRSILHTPRSAAEVAQELGIDGKTLRQRVDAARPKLLAARAKRPPPLRDDKVQASWNGLMIAAFARGARILGDERYRAAASRAAAFIDTSMRGSDGALQHVWLERRTSGLAFAEDHAFLALGLLELFAATSDPKHLTDAIQHLLVLERDFRAPGGGLYRTTTEHEALLARQVEGYDGAIPTASSVAAQAQLLAYRYTTQEPWRERAETTLRAFAGTLRDKPWALTVMAEAVDDLTGSPKEVVIAYPPDASRSDVQPLLDVMAKTYAPHHAFVAVGGEAAPALEGSVPWVKGKKPKAAGPTAYVCERGACELPTTDPTVFEKQLRAFTPYPGSPAAEAK